MNATNNSAVISHKSMGFTLAETLITLVVIGVIAALTVPSLIQKHRAEEFETRFKKAISILNSAVNYYKFDTGEDMTVENATETRFKDVIRKHFQIMEDCGVTKCFDNAKPPYRNYANNADISRAYFNEGVFVLNDGMTIFIDQDSTDLALSVDINGYWKKPNRYGYDVFTFPIATKTSNYNSQSIKGRGKVLPGGHPYTRYNDSLCSKTSSNAINGIACAYQATQNQNYFKELMY